MVRLPDAEVGLRLFIWVCEASLISTAARTGVPPLNGVTKAGKQVIRGHHMVEAVVTSSMARLEKY
jgi:hypothetical protein